MDENFSNQIQLFKSVFKGNGPTTDELQQLRFVSQ
jgi:hypothetical protein